MKDGDRCVKYRGSGIISRMLILNMLICLLSGCGSTDGKPEDKGHIQQTGGAEQLRIIADGAQRILEAYDAEDRKEETEQDVQTDGIEIEKAYYIFYDNLHPYNTQASPEIDDIPILLLYIPDNPDKEERINSMLEKRYEKVLPMDQEWLDSAVIRITYHSDRYLCFKYDFQRTLPEGYERQDLFFTLDLQQEKLIEYPEMKPQTVPRNLWVWGTVYEEMEEWQELSVEEQNRMRGGAEYQLYGDWFGYAGGQIPCIRVKGIGDSDLENRINEELCRPLRALLAGQTDPDIIALFTNQMHCFVAYQTERYLSVVYLIECSEWDKWSDGIAHIGVTIDMQTGERLRLDDLFDFDGLLWWLCMNDSMSEDGLRERLIRGSVLSEEEFVENYCEDRVPVWYYEDNCYSFYLYQGKVEIMVGPYQFMHQEIPLPEVYEYLKVDPWY